MIVRQLKVGPMDNFVYVLADERTKEALVVDSGWETEPIVKAVAKLGARVNYVVASHGHFDHVSTIDEVAGKLGAKVVAHQSSVLRRDVSVGHGSELALGESRIRVLDAPGHTGDSICLYDGGEVFTGDVLFVGTVGRFEDTQVENMFRSLHEVILTLPPTTMMYPGHDYGEVPCRTLGEEAEKNPYLGPKDLRTFVSLFS
jgi:hydroxyacylglutathione hydrolase